MADVLGNGLAWLDGQRHQHMTRPVMYRRGHDEIALDATAGRTEFEQVDEAGFVTKTDAIDWIVRRSDLTFGNRQTDPVAGDQIIDAQHVFEVMSLGGEPPFRFTDTSRSSLRIHTKLVREIS